MSEMRLTKAATPNLLLDGAPSARPLPPGGILSRRVLRRIFRETPREAPWLAYHLFPVRLEHAR